MSTSASARALNSSVIGVARSHDAASATATPMTASATDRGSPSLRATGCVAAIRISSPATVSVSESMAGIAFMRPT